MGRVTGGGKPAAKAIWWAALPAAALGLLAAVSAEAPAAQAAEVLAQATEQRSFDIPAQPLPSALPLFGQQADIQISAGVSRPISYANNGFNSLFDAELVKVFRGPQTTVRGANAISGAFVINTKNPVFDRQATIQGNLEYDEIGDIGYRNGLMYNDVLIEDQLASRFVLEYEEAEIPIDYLAPGENAPNDSLSELDRIAGRAKLLLEPSALPDFSGLLQLEYQEGRDPAFDSSVTGTSFGGDPDKRINRFAQRVFDTRAFGGKLDLSYFFGSDELKSTTSYFRDSYSDNPDSTETFVGFDNVVDERFVQDLTYAFEDVGGFASGIVGVTLQRQDKTGEYGLSFDFDTFGERETAVVFADTTLSSCRKLACHILCPTIRTSSQPIDAASTPAAPA